MKTNAILSATLLLSAIPAIAGSTIPNLTDTATVTTTTEDGWRYGTSVYIWATDLSGDMTVHGKTVPVDIGFDKLLDHIDYAFMGTFEIGKGRWSVLSDLFYAKLSAENTILRSSAETELEQLIGNLAVTYRWIDTGTTRFDTYAGARLNWMETDVEIHRPTGKTWSGSGDQTWIDPIIGVRFQQDLSDKFFFRTVADIGGFGVSSDLTWQAMAAFGYRVSEHGAVGIGYRALGTDYSHNNLTYDIVSHGLLLGYEYRF